MIHVVDAFTLEPGTGNRAGVVFEADDLSSEQMQAIASFAAYSETAFVLEPCDAGHDIEVRFFTPSTEVPICGHATIATHFLRAQQLDLGDTTLVAKTGAGNLAVTIEGRGPKAKIVMHPATPDFGPKLTTAQAETMIRALGLDPAVVSDDLPIQIVSTGHSKVMVPVTSKEALDQLAPDMKGLTAISSDIGCNGFFVFVVEGLPDQPSIYGRMFAPAIGIAEDPVTGNANGPAGAYLVHHGVISLGDGVTILGHQGHAMGRPGVVEVRIRPTEGRDFQVEVAGNAVQVDVREYSTVPARSPVRPRSDRGTMAQLPPEIVHPAAWYGSDMSSDPGRWTRHLTEAEVAAVGRAADSFLATGRDLATITMDDLCLGDLTDELLGLRSELMNGRGFGLLRGIPVESWGIEKSAAAFMGIGAHVGQLRSQNAMGHVLGHVRDLGRRSADPSVRVYQTSERQTFHADSADVVGLICLHDALEGGESLLVSAVTIFNEMRQRRPDLAALLFEPIATDRRGEIPEGMLPYYLIPVLSWHQNKLTVMYQRQYIDSAQRFDDAPQLTADHMAALDLFDTLANDPHLHFRMRLQPGDIQFVYNHHLLHDRTGYIDRPEGEARRHLLRLWLSVPADRSLPPVFAERYGTITPGDRGGIVVPQSKLHAPLEPA